MAGISFASIGPSVESFRPYFHLLRDNARIRPGDVKKVTKRLVQQEILLENHKVLGLFLDKPQSRPLIIPQQLLQPPPEVTPPEATSLEVTPPETTPAKSAFYKLPNEVLAQILNESNTVEHPEDACALALSCKTFATASQMTQKPIVMTPKYLNNIMSRPKNTRYCSGCRKSRPIRANFTGDLDDWLHPQPGSHFTPKTDSSFHVKVVRAYYEWEMGAAVTLPDGTDVVWCPSCAVQAMIEERRVNYQYGRADHFVEIARMKRLRFT